MTSHNDGRIILSKAFSNENSFPRFQLNGNDTTVLKNNYKQRKYKSFEIILILEDGNKYELGAEPVIQLYNECKISDQNGNEILDLES